MSEHTEDLLRLIADASDVIKRFRMLLDADDCGVVDVQELLADADAFVSNATSDLPPSCYDLLQAANSAYHLDMDQRVKDLDLRVTAGLLRLSWVVPVSALDSRLDAQFREWTSASAFVLPSLDARRVEHLKTLLWLGALLMQAAKQVRKLKWAENVLIEKTYGNE